MKPIFLIILLTCTLAQSKLLAEFDEILPVVPQITTTAAGCTLEFQSNFSKAYFYQWSTDLTNWSYLPFIDEGTDDPISFGFNCDTSELFLRVLSVDRFISIDPDGIDFVPIDPNLFDFDDDGLGSFAEITANPQLDPFDPDTDGDGLNDGFEIANGFDPSSIFSFGGNIPDGALDSDGDGASNIDEQNNGGDPNEAIDEGNGTLKVIGDGEVDVEITDTRSYTIPAGGSGYMVIARVASDEFPDFTGDQSKFNDLLRWKIKPSLGLEIEGEVNVNSLHDAWKQAQAEGTSFMGTSTVAVQFLGIVRPSATTEVNVEVEIGVTNIGDGTLPSTAFISLIPLDLTVEEEKLTLLEENTLAIRGDTDLLNEFIDNVTFEIRRENTADWFEVQDGANLEFTGKARVAGHFEVRAMLEIDDRRHTTEIETIEVQFPSADEILAGDGVRERMDQAWQNTLNNTANNRRREEGYYITLNTVENGQYGITGYTEGDNTLNNAAANLRGFPIPRPDDVPLDPLPLQSATYTVAWFHTHTPTRYRTPPGGTRVVGPSGPDIRFSNSFGIRIPGYAYDYSPTTVSPVSGRPAVPHGHPVNSEAEVYPITPERRETP